MHLLPLIPGTREQSECAGHGLCDTATGKCACFNGFVSSNGNGSKGLRGDCGYVDTQSDDNVFWRGLAREVVNS